MASISLKGSYHQPVRYYIWECVWRGESVQPLKICLCAENAAGFGGREQREAQSPGQEVAVVGTAVGRSPTSWEGRCAYFPFNGDLYAETDHFSQLTGLPAGLLTCSIYFQPMNLLMKMSFTWNRKQWGTWDTIGSKAKEKKNQCQQSRSPENKHLKFQ